MTPTVEKPVTRIYCVRKSEHAEIIRIHAQTVCEEGSHNDHRLTFKRDGNIVGKVFSADEIDWWIEEVSA